MKILKILLLVLFMFCTLRAGGGDKIFVLLEAEVLADLFENGFKENAFVLAILGLQGLGVFAAIKDGYTYNKIMLIVTILLGCIVAAALMTIMDKMQIGVLPNIAFLGLATIYIIVYLKKYRVI